MSTLENLSTSQPPLENYSGPENKGKRDQIAKDNKKFKEDLKNNIKPEKTPAQILQEQNTKQEIYDKFPPDEIVEAKAQNNDKEGEIEASDPTPVKKTTGSRNVTKGLKLLGIAALSVLAPLFGNAQKHNKNTEQLLTQKLEAIKTVLDSLKNAKLEEGKDYLEMQFGKEVVSGLTLDGALMIPSPNPKIEVFVLKFSGPSNSLRNMGPGLEAIGLEAGDASLLPAINNAAFKKAGQYVLAIGDYKILKKQGKYNEQDSVQVVTSRGPVRTQPIEKETLDINKYSIIAYRNKMIEVAEKIETIPQYTDGFTKNK